MSLIAARGMMTVYHVFAVLLLMALMLSVVPEIDLVILTA
jgi:hypothetical protein